MNDQTRLPESDPLRHTQKLKQMLHDVANHAREDVSKVSDPKAQALFETTAEVLLGLAKAYDDFEQKNEKAWA
jgi:hypothetical protein